MRKILCLLLALVTCCLVIAAVSTVETKAAVPTTCAAGCENPVWQALPSANWDTLEAGHYHYYLNGNTAKTKIMPNSDTKLTICLDLNGYHIAPDGYRPLGVYSGCVLNIMDSSTGKTGYVEGNTGSNNPVGGTIFNYGTVNLYSGTLRYVYDGVGTNPTFAGGVLSQEGESATFNMYGGRLEGGELVLGSYDRSYGATIYASAGDINLYGGEIISGTVPAGKNGPCVYLNGAVDLTLSGSAKVDNIFIDSADTTVNVSGTYSGTAGLTYGSSITPTNGMVIGAATDNPDITGSLFCTNGDGWLVEASGNDLVLSADSTAILYNGTEVRGFPTLQEAVVEASDGGYIKLMLSSTENVTISNDLQLDLNGKSINGTVTVAEGKTLYVKDSQTDDYTVSDGAYGKLAVTGNVVGQNGYLKVTEDGKVSFHKVQVAINAMTLRSKDAGIYYESVFLGDEVVEGVVESFGVALSVVETPDVENMDTACKYTAFTDFTAGKDGNPSTSTLLKNVLSDGNSYLINNRNLKMNVYGRPYLKTVDGYYFGNVVTRSLKQQLEDVDSIVDDLTATQMYELEDLYVRFESLLSKCNLNNVVDMINDDTLSILMVGNSFCYYYVEELYGLLMANPDPNRGYTDVEIYNLYYSGCSLTQHYDWWVAGQAKYDLYKTDAKGRVKQTPASGSEWTLEDTLQQGRWDYLSLQGASTGNDYANGDRAVISASVAELAAPLLDRFHELHPNAQLLWHRTWPFEVGRVSGSTTYDEELLEKYNEGMQIVCDYMCNEFDKDKDYDLIMVNSGAAWPIARQENAKLETSLIPEGGLCARKGIRNEKTYPLYTDNANAGDGYHDGDIGGGQFLNACVWYEQLTGQSCLDNPYKPELTTGNKYELSEALLSLLRNAAHAVKADNQ